MPPQPAKSISSYFNKTPTKAVAVAFASTTPTTSSSITAVTDGVKATVTETTISSSPIQPTIRRTNVLSDAARRAIDEGVNEGSAAKKAKLSDGSAKPSEHLLLFSFAPSLELSFEKCHSQQNSEVADVFLKAAVPSPVVHVAHGSSRSDLRSSLASHARALSVLEMELDTLGLGLVTGSSGRADEAILLLSMATVRCSLKSADGSS